MFEEADFLKENNNEIAFFSMHHPKNNPDYKYSQYFIDYVELSNLGKEYSFFKKLFIAKDFIYNHKAAKLFARFLDDFKPDIIHCHGIAHQISPSILKVAKVNNIPVVQTLHDYQLICPNYTFMLTAEKVCNDHKCIKGQYYNCFIYKCSKKSYIASFISMNEAYFNNLTGIYKNNIDKFIAPSHFLRNLMLDSGVDKEKIIHIPNFVKEYKGSTELKNDRFFLYVGRLSFEKGLKTLINTFKNLPDIPLKIIGTGPIESELMEIKENNNLNNIEFLGFIDRNKIEEYIRSCEALILPSEWYENAPISIIEAFSMEKPVVASKIGGLPEMIKDNFNGYLFQAGNTDSLKDIILKFNDNKHLSFELGKNARTYYDKEFNKEKHMNALLSLYKSILR